MKRRSLFRLALAAVAAPFVTKKVVEDFGPHTAMPAPKGIAFNPDAFKVAMESLDRGPFPPLTPFAEFDAPIEAMQTITSTAGDEMLLVISGGLAYIVDRHGTVTRL